MKIFANPNNLWLLLLLIGYIGYYILRVRLGGPSIRISSAEGVRKAPLTWRFFARHIPFVLRLAALACIIVAMARPQRVNENQTTQTEGIDIVIAMDVSGSMLARDFEPDRLSAAKDVAADFIAGRVGDRMGLVVFAGEAYSPSPLTANKNEVQTALAKVRSGVIEDGTAIGNGLATAINRLRESQSKSKVVILLTDGVNNSGVISPLMAADIAMDLGIKVYTIGVGKNGMAPYPAYDMFGQLVFQQMPVEIDEETLTEISKKTNGKYFRATDKQTLKEIYKEIDTLEKSKIEVQNQITIDELYLIWVLVAFALLALEWLIDNVLLKRLP
ncbi:MAG: VWA domain-containing protein [Alistipes sp.]|nr:VWA domain-containing protein [Alistipes sp.]